MSYSIDHREMFSPTPLSDKQRAFINAFEEAVGEPKNGVHHIKGVSLLIEFGRLSGLDEVVTLSRIYSENPGNGEASRALKAFLDCADKHGVGVVGDAVPFSPGQRETDLTPEQLKDWYKRHGFVCAGRQLGLGAYFMARDPRPSGFD